MDFYLVNEGLWGHRIRRVRGAIYRWTAFHFAAECDSIFHERHADVLPGTPGQNPRPGRYVGKCGTAWGQACDVCFALHHTNTTYQPNHTLYTMPWKLSGANRSYCVASQAQCRGMAWHSVVRTTLYTPICMQMRRVIDPAWVRLL